MADANALSLSEYAVMSNDPLVQKITYSLLVNGSILPDIPLVTKKSMKVNTVRWENTMTVNWAKLNEVLTVVKGKPTAYAEQMFLVRNAIDIDYKILEDVNNIGDPRAAQIGNYIYSLAYDFNDKVINNNHISGDADAPVGFRDRLDNPTLYGCVSELKIDCGGVDMRGGSNTTAAIANQFIEYIQTLLSYLGREEGDNVFLYMNDLMKRRFETAVRILGAGAGWRTDMDAFDRAISKYKNATIVDIGRKGDQTTRIITNTETAAGLNGSSTFTSIYGAVLEEERFSGWQWEELGSAIKPIGPIGNDGTIDRTMIDWGIGLKQEHSRAIGRLYDIKVA